MRTGDASVAVDRLQPVLSLNPISLKVESMATEITTSSGGRVLVKFTRTVLEFLVVGACAISFGITMQLFVFSLLKSDTVGTRDFSVYWATGQQLAHHANPYDADAMLRIERSLGFPPAMGPKFMRNPPWMLPVTLPLGFLGVRVASMIWSTLLLLCLVLSVRLLWALNGSPKSKRDWLGYAFAPGLLCLILGQSSIFALLGLVLFLRWHKSMPFLAGCALWLCLLKPHLFLPLGVVLLLWILISRSYWILFGATLTLGLSLVGMFLVDPLAWKQYSAMLHTSEIELDYIPCLSFLLRAWISPGSNWIQYVPSAFGCVWAIWYFWGRRRTWDWVEHSSRLILVSTLVAPYYWLFDQVVVMPALLQGAYAARSRDLLLALAFASALIEGALFAGGAKPSAVYLWTLWTTPFWLIWYLVATAKKTQAAVPPANAETLPS
jgi:hypothetical protein